MKKLLFAGFLLTLVFTACKKDYGASFAGTYKGTFVTANIPVPNVTVSVSDNGDNNITISPTVVGLTTSLQGECSSETAFTIPTQTYNSSSISGSGSLDGTTLTFTYTASGGAVTVFTGEKQ